MDCPFIVGQRVVCIDDSWREPDLIRFLERVCHYRFPRLNHVYTVRGVLIYQFDPTPDVGVYLEELRNPVIQWRDGDYSELAFSPCRFRPLQTRPTDIEVFQRIRRRVSVWIHEREDA